MLPAYILRVDIISDSRVTDQSVFVAQVASSLNHLHDLKEAFDRKPCTIAYYPPGVQSQSSGWSVRGLVTISVGRQRGEALKKLYQATVELIAFELPDLKIEAEISEFAFS